MGGDRATDAPARTPGPAEVEFREVINAVRYLVRSGCGWRMLPAHFGHWRTVYGWFRELARRFLFHDVALMVDPEGAGREASPSAAVNENKKGPAWNLKGLRRRQESRQAQTPHHG